MATVRIPANSWQPRPHQRKLWDALENGATRAIEIAHRRWGKDEVALHYAATQAIQAPATYWHMLPEYSQARKAIWNAINPHSGIRRIDEAFPEEIRESTNDHEMFIRFVTGATWQVVGSDSYKSLVGSPPKGIVFSEWAKAHPGAWAYLAPILEENGGWGLFITTPEGENHAHAMYEMAKRNPRWFAELQTVEDTGFPLERVEEARKEYHALYGIDAGDALIQQEYYCSFQAAILGAVYSKWITQADKEGRICDNVYDESLPVHTAWDLGFDDATAIWWWQITGGEVRLIDYYEASGEDIAHYCDVITRRGYKYGKHYVPHDAANKLLAAGGRSIVQQAYELGVKMFVVAATTQQNSIEAARKTLEASWFCREKTVEGISTLRYYQFEFDEDKKVFKHKPRHDWTSHGADAFEIIGQVWRNPPEEKVKPKPKFLHDMTANDLFWPKQGNIQHKERI